MFIAVVGKEVKKNRQKDFSLYFFSNGE